MDFSGKKKKTEGSRKEAKDRLDSITGGRRYSVPVREVIPQDILQNSGKDMVHQIKTYLPISIRLRKKTSKFSLKSTTDTW